MFLSGEKYLSQIEKIFAESADLSIAVAFWGQGAEALLDKWQGKRLRILCNLESGATNPAVIRKFLAWKSYKPFSIEVRSLSDLHAKVVLGEDSMVIGSANISANGLSYEDVECRGWQEAGLLTGSAPEIEAARVWFQRLWEQARQEITEDQLKQAEINWAKRRQQRLPLTPAGSLLQAPIEVLRDRPIHLAIYRTEDVPDGSMECFDKAVQQADAGGSPCADLDFFYDWPVDGEDVLPIDAPLIRVYYGPRKGIRVRGIWVRIPQLDQRYRDGKQDVPVSIIARLDRVQQWTLSTQDQAELAKRLLPWLESVVYAGNLEDMEPRCRRLDTFLQWEMNSNTSKR